MQTKLYFLFIMLASPLCALAQSTDLSAEEEIQLLITKVENSACTFHRNGGTHSAVDAADHIRLKLRRGSRHAKTSQSFIDRLASKSSLSGRPYKIECDQGELILMKTWLDTELQAIRG